MVIIKAQQYFYMKKYFISITILAIVTLIGCKNMMRWP